MCVEVLLDEQIRQFTVFLSREDELKLKKVKVSFFPHKISFS